MEIIKADHMGFCMGVSRAVDLLENAIIEYPGKTIVTLGPLIHNPQVLNDFKNRGVSVIDKPEDVPKEAVVIIRAHGVSPQSIEILKERKATIIDGTCPKVIASQKIVAEYTKKGYKVIIAGDRGHGEVVGLTGLAEIFEVIEDTGEAENLSEQNQKFRESDKIILIAQTTFNSQKFSEISSLLKKKYPELTVKNTLCPATGKREEALLKLKGKIDALLVIGGKNSANTTNLFRKGVEIIGKAWHIEDINDLPDEIFSFRRIGITAGASTSSQTVEKVIQFLKNRTEK